MIKYLGFKGFDSLESKYNLHGSKSLGWEDPLEKEMATHSSILVLEIPWTEKPGRLQAMGPQRVGHN